MGYSYTVLVGLYEVSKDVKDDKKKYQQLLTKLIDEFKEDEDYLCFGEDDSSGSKGLGCGTQEWWTEKLENYSKKFPDTTLEFYLSYWDYTNLSILRYRNGKRIFLKEYDFESDGIKVDDTLTLFPKLNQRTLWYSVTNNITSYFTGDLKVIEESSFGESLDY